MDPVFAVCVKEPIMDPPSRQAGRRQQGDLEEQSWQRDQRCAVYDHTVLRRPQHTHPPPRSRSDGAPGCALYENGPLVPTQGFY